jgi:hypothetical protein
MAIISKTAQTHRTNTITLEVIDEGIAVIKHKTHILLVFFMSFNNYVVCPQFFPKGTMCHYQRLLANQHSSFNNAQGLINRILMMSRRNEGANEAEPIDLSFSDVYGSSHKMVVGIPILM